MARPDGSAGILADEGCARGAAKETAAAPADRCVRRVKRGSKVEEIDGEDQR